MLDALAERYNKLPSEVLDKADTLDLWVYDVAISYRTYKQGSEDDKNKKMDQKSLQDLMDSVKNRK
jgi:hypothetical protein